MISKILENEQELSKQLDVLESHGFDVGEDSNITKLLTSISGTNSINKKEIEDIISKLTFDGRSGKLLDDIYNFFGIPRIIKNVNGASVQILNNGNYDITIMPNTIIEYDNKSYRVTTTQYISQRETKEIYCNPTGIKLMDNYVTLGQFKIQLNNIEIENVNEVDKENYIVRNVLISNLSLILDKETDLEYKSRASGLIQHFGDGSITKIKNYIMGIENVSDVRVERGLNRVRIIIIPEELRFLNEITRQAKESVDYFSSSPVFIENPTITQLSISGVLNQLLDWFGKDTNADITGFIYGVREYMKEYVTDVTLSKDKYISRDSIEFTINKYFVDKSIQFSLDEKKLKIDYSIYSDEDYIEPIITNSLTIREKKEIKTDILILGDVS